MRERLLSYLRGARLARGLSQRVLASQLGISPQALRAIESGRAIPATDLALRMAAALDCTVEALFRLPDKTSDVPVYAPRPLPPSARVQLTPVDGRLIARPLRGDRGLAYTLPWADAIATGPSSVRLLAPPDSLERRLLVAGCDPAMALLAQALLRSRTKVELLWEESGSRAALEALARREVHIAGCHLFDESSGTFNRRFVEQSIPFACTLVTFATWEQGLVVASGNPHSIRDVAALARPGIRLINRELGAGSRSLLDTLLRKARVPKQAVIGYDHVARGHLAVAACVAEGMADVGIGVKAAALALDLDFVPLAQERYDLVIPNHRLHEPSVQVLLDLLTQPAFRAEIEALGGYDISPMGSTAA